MTVPCYGTLEIVGVIIIIFNFYFFKPSISMILKEEKIKLDKMWNSLGHPSGGCLQENFPAAKQSWIAVQQPKLDQKAGLLLSLKIQSYVNSLPAWMNRSHWGAWQVWMWFHCHCLVGVVLTNIFIHLVDSQRLPILYNINTTVIRIKVSIAGTQLHRVSKKGPNFETV